ncbi:substrate-binding domain-containing protein [Paraburkholderia phenoliruptrix]|uniref:Periplasmic-binding protein/LacI transcriptional regulator n=2 Tax=Paraburkholderia phenoliruptrix TaxID=252970 RepID=K0DV16_9BURK|nr:substrate-binding domain-containing protein [Paraburkholderia phenoliruptrix]AFT88557.1 periplasmic-binding protein/LacI transcriptional regulator [Paraburkholderia phenoliruptrix BR3459a]MDR6418823.1 ribose transport system substrate-binding protein [Paraburkholderia phenoliruptrix]WMY11629.1 substrate-binding domain-containing protein [Paraburkholderia phenoliruptrix]CAB4047492.1 D-allose-binding periplasmic protein [Paraburkholderia phenoliruptrix]
MTQSMRRRVLIAGALAAAGLARAAGAAAVESGTPKIALVLKSLSDPFTVAMANAAKNYQQHYASQFVLTVSGTATEPDTAGQIRIVEQMIGAKMNAIVLAPSGSKGLTSVVARAIKAGIIVITIDNPLDEALQDAAKISVPFVGPDNRKGAMLVANYLAERLKAGDQVGIIEGIAADRNAQQRTAGYREAMSAAGMQVVATEAGDWEYGKGRDIASKMLGQHPQIRGLLCANDNMAMGAADAVRDAGRTGSVYITGYNAIDAIKPLIADGHVLATVNQFADRQAVFGMDVALKAVTEQRKQSELSPVIETPLQLVTAPKR